MVGFTSASRVGSTKCPGRYVGGIDRTQVRVFFLKNVGTSAARSPFRAVDQPEGSAPAETSLVLGIGASKSSALIRSRAGDGVANRIGESLLQFKRVSRDGDAIGAGRLFRKVPRESKRESGEVICVLVSEALELAATAGSD